MMLMGLFLVAGGQTSETLDCSKEPLDDIAMFVTLLAIEFLHLAGRVGTDTGGIRQQGSIASGRGAAFGM